MRQAQAEAKKEIEEYKAMREAKLKTIQPEVRTTAQHANSTSIFALHSFGAEVVDDLLRLPSAGRSIDDEGGQNDIGN